jgi:glycosyltransferase involved in cell wall biosynthesis
MKRVIVLVSNDLSHDQRVRKTCDALIERGFEPLLVGRRLKNSVEMERPYPCVRFQLFFDGGALFYAALNLRLFFFLLFRKADLIWANDLDTLLPAFLVSKLKKIDLFYDSHEYFTEAAGLEGRSFQKRTWESIEKFCFPKLQRVTTVNQSIAEIYEKKYGIPVKVLRNVPEYQDHFTPTSRADLGLDENKYIAILQGAFLDVDRGALEAVAAIPLLPERFQLLLIGAGEEHEASKAWVKERGLEDRIIIKNKLPYLELKAYTAAADLGLTLDKGLYFNYLYSLPNKIFDYVHAGIPVLATDLPEVGRVVKQEGIGKCIEKCEPALIAEAILEMEALGKSSFQGALQKAQKKFYWQEEVKVIDELLSTKNE